MNNKLSCVIQCSLETISGYGLMSRDICRHIIELDLYDVKIISTGWGMLPMHKLDPIKDVELIKRIVPQPINIDRQPDIFIQISVPNEFIPAGKYNIGITAGIETNAISMPWLQGCNRMHTVWTISTHSKDVIEHTIVNEQTVQGQILNQHKVTVPVEILYNCIDTSVFNKITEPELLEDKIKELMSSVKEKFCFLCVGHWLPGGIGEDRKGIGLLVDVFCQAFKNIPKNKQPALVLKSSGGGFSILDREEILKKISDIRKKNGSGSPNVYLIHGELTDPEMNSLYNHPKIKTSVNLYSGEGFAKTIAEFTQTQKPIIASGWSGPVDFLDKDHSILIPGILKQIPASVVWKDVLIPESQWFYPDPSAAGSAMLYVFKNYDTALTNAKPLAKLAREKLEYNIIKNRTKELLEKYVPKMAVQVPVKLPSLKKITPKIEHEPVEAITG